MISSILETFAQLVIYAMFLTAYILVMLMLFITFPLWIVPYSLHKAKKDKEDDLY